MTLRGRSTAARQTCEASTHPTESAKLRRPFRDTPLVSDGQAFPPWLPSGICGHGLPGAGVTLGKVSWGQGLAVQAVRYPHSLRWGNKAFREGGLGSTLRFSTRQLFFCKLCFHFILFPPINNTVTMVQISKRAKGWMRKGTVVVSF